MPQLVPFYFVNQITFVFIVMLMMLYVLSKYILPKFVSLFMTRISICKL